MEWILFGLFIVLALENHFKPRLFITDYKDLIIWYTRNGGRRFYIICSFRDWF